jgi:outer membrane lipoprotein carrier protein
MEEPPEEGVLRVKLVPRHEHDDVRKAFIDVEPSGRIRSILLEDVQGNRTRFRFDSVRENTGLKDEIFRFTPPPGTEVIRG